MNVLMPARRFLHTMSYLSSSLKIRILGCGSSAGVPLIYGHWGDCDPNHPKNRRSRSSILLQDKDKHLLIDASPDLRQQLLRENIQHIDAVLMTHAHADHCLGLDELRQIFFHQQRKIPVFADPSTMETLCHRFSYMFHQTNAAYPSYLESLPLDDTALSLGTLYIKAFDQDHGHQKSTGYKVKSPHGTFAYSTDVLRFPETAHQHLYNLDLWIVDCLRYHPHPTHAHFDQTMAWVKMFQPRHVVLTHMSEYLDFDDLSKRCNDALGNLPQTKTITPAWDGMMIELSQHNVKIP